MLAEGVCEAILDWVVLGHPCPGGVTGSSSEALWALPTYQWHWPWHMALQHTCCQFNGLKPYPSAEERSRVRIASAMFSRNWEKQNAPFMFIMSVLSPTLGTRPQSFGGTGVENQYRGRTTSCCFRLASAETKIDMFTNSFNPSDHTSMTPKVCKQEVSPAHLFRGSRSNRKNRQIAGASTDSHPQP